MTSAPNQTALRLFASIAPTYQRWARVLSLGQDGLWRRVMVEGLSPPSGGKILDVAAGTGSISRRLQAMGHQVTAVDLSAEMLGLHPGPDRVQARAEMLPFEANTFDALTFGYLLRYVDDPVAAMIELTRVVKPGGRLGMVEFGLPGRFWRGPWEIYAGAILPTAGRIISPGWYEVGRFLKGSIEDFHNRYPDPASVWRQAGLIEVEVRRLSLGGGLVMWASKP
jgi:demethylmenaquinone methyltransferase/2-methoxy-6-polyprenyl-1,4-benzoquinol methylase